MTRDGDGDRGHRQHQPGGEPGDPAEAPAHEVVEKADARNPHQRLRHEDAERVEPEDPDRKRLDPQGERRLVDGHDPARVERAVEEVVPARRHRPDRRAVVVVGPAVPAQRPQVEHGREHEQQRQLRSRQAPAQRPQSLAQPLAAIRKRGGRSPGGGGRGGYGGGFRWFYSARA